MPLAPGIKLKQKKKVKTQLKERFKNGVYRYGFKSHSYD